MASTDSPVVSAFAPVADGFGCPDLALDQAIVAEARALAAQIAGEVTAFANTHTTVAVQRTLLRLFGVTGATDAAEPLVSAVVRRLHACGGLAGGVARPFCAALVATGLTSTELATNIADGNVQLQEYLSAPLTAEVVALGQQLAAAGLQRIIDQRAVRTERLQTLGSGPQPLLYVIVASGNIYEDVVQARVAVRQGADIIAVIRSTGQSLLDYVPEGPTTEGYGGTYATEANFALMRAALDDIGAEVGRYIRLCNYASGLCMPEIAVLGGLQRLDMMLNDALYGILFRDINMQRTLCDQQLSRKLSALAGIVINTGEDNYLTTADAVDAAHTVVASTLINEALARSAGLQTWQLGLGHAMEIDPERPGAIVLEIAQATLLRQLFPGAPLKYMPPTKHMTGNVLRGHVQDTLFNVVGVLTGQGIQLLGMPTEAMHTPHIHDRAWALEAARLAFDGARALGGELQIRPGGQIAQRAAQTLLQARDLLADMAKDGLFVGLSRGLFADIARSPTGGRGLDGVARRATDYWDPSESLLDAQLAALPAEPPPAVPARGPAPRHGGQS